MKMKTSLSLLLLLLTSPCTALEPISAPGHRLEQVFESMHVEQLWLAGGVVNWKTGEPTGKPVTDNGKHTHCSQFAAAVCERLGVYLLRPPEHGSVLLANAQFDWLPAAGRGQGWAPVADGAQAQDLANRGQIVIAVCKNPDPKKAGHTAVVRPGAKPAELIAKEGPDVIQAGGHNYERASLKQGFANHAEQFTKGEIRYYTHPVPVAEAAR